VHYINCNPYADGRVVIILLTKIHTSFIKTIVQSIIA